MLEVVYCYSIQGVQISIALKSGMQWHDTSWGKNIYYIFITKSTFLWLALKSYIITNQKYCFMLTLARHHHTIHSCNSLIILF